MDTWSECILGQREIARRLRIGQPIRRSDQEALDRARSAVSQGGSILRHRHSPDILPISDNAGQDRR